MVPSQQEHNDYQHQYFNISFKINDLMITRLCASIIDMNVTECNKIPFFRRDHKTGVVSYKCNRILNLQ